MASTVQSTSSDPLSDVRPATPEEAREQIRVLLHPKYDNYDFPFEDPGNEPDPRHFGWLTKNEIGQLEKLRASLEAKNYIRRLDTLTLLRFLRARGMDAEQAEAMFIASEEWRMKENVDELPATFVYDKRDEIFQYYPQYYHKTDKDGRPLYIEELGKIDLTAMNRIIGGTEEEAGNEMRKNLIVEYEKLADPRLPACSRKAGKLIETCCTIMDAKGVGYFIQPSIISFVQSAMKLSQDNYPERLGKLYVINTNWAITAAWKVCSVFLDAVTKDKIHVGSSIEELKKQIPEENLPEYFGGKCRCEGKLGCRGSNAGPWNEAQYQSPKKTGEKLEDVASNVGAQHGPTSETKMERDAATVGAENAAEAS